MGQAVQIRAATAADVAALDAVDAVAWDLACTPGPLPLPLPFDARLPLAGTVVAVVGDEIVGYAALAADQGLPVARPGGVLRSLAVAPPHRGRGVAGALLAAVDALARARGYRQMVLFVLGSNHRARRVYTRAGYRELVVFPGEYAIAGALVDDIVMGKEL
jgi:ribosomal protein S18 acetylase RimI-like enzyme